MSTGTCPGISLVMAGWESEQNAPRLPPSAGCPVFASLNELHTEDKDQPFSGWKKRAEASNRLSYLGFGLFKELLKQLTGGVVFWTLSL